METALAIRKISEMREVMKDPHAPAPEELYSRQRTSLQAQRAAYYMIRKPEANITVLPEYHLGQEYPKTYGHFHQPESEERYEILLGDAAILIQKGIDPVEETRLVKLKKGDSFTVPKGYAHSLINLGKGPVVTLDNHDPAKCVNNYDPIRERRGLAYYITEEGGKVRTVSNPNYSKTLPLKNG